MPTARRKRPFVERRGDRWRVRWPDADGDLRSATRDGDGNYFADEAAAERYGWEQMGQIDRGEWQDPRRSGITLTQWANHWWQANGIDELSEKSVRKYRTDIEHHLLPAFGDWTLAELADDDGSSALAAWLTRHRAEYAANTVENRRNLYSTIFNDAVATGRMSRNPLARANRRGRRSKKGDERPEKTWVTPLQALLIAERAAVYAGDVTAFVMVIGLAYTGMRSRELVGLERRYVHADTLQVQWQLVEYTGRLERERPKYDSRRTIDVPPFLAHLLGIEMRRHDGRCGCTGHKGGPYVLAGGPKTPHLNSVTTNNWFRAAACSRYYSRRAKGYVPIPVVAGPLVGEPTFGRRRPDATWVPIAAGATPHSLRHSHRVWMDDDGIPEVLMHERLGHDLEGIRGVYSHVSPDARQRLCDALTARWEQSLRQRATLHPHSPVPLLDDLLRPLREGENGIPCSQTAPEVAPLRPRRRLAG